MWGNVTAFGATGKILTHVWQDEGHVSRSGQLEWGFIVNYTFHSSWVDVIFYYYYFLFFTAGVLNSF